MKKTVLTILLILFAVSILPATVKAKDGTERPSVALVLSGGGAKGIAHIPIIAELERYGIPIDKVFGTSMGALVGGLYASGYSPKEMIGIVTGQDLSTMFTSILSSGYNEVLNAFDYSSNNVLSLSLSQGIGGTTGLIDDYMILNFLVKYMGNVPTEIDFDKDLVIPFECNAADMITGDEVIFTEGSLLTAMRSSMSIPIAFEPVITEDGNVYMDGGVVSNYIVHRAVEEGYDIIICVTLGGYDKTPARLENYTSLSGVLGGTLSVVLTNVSKGELDGADFWFAPDETMYGTMSFGEVEGILEQSYIEVAEQQDKFREIASLFTEGQKEYKDADRVSEYHTKYPEQWKQTYLSSKEALHEDLLGRTRVSVGLYGSGGYGFFFDPDLNESERRTKRAFFPTFSLRTFIKDLGGSRISLDNRIRSTISRTTDFSAMAMLRISKDFAERTFLTLRANASIGSLSNFTDKTESISLNEFIEQLVSADLGLMLTNEQSHSIMLYGRTELVWAYPYSETSDKLVMAFIPSVHLEAVFYPGYSNGFFGSSGSRFDFSGYLGWNSFESKHEYKLAVAAEHNFTLSETTSLWVDFTAVTSRGNQDMRSLFETYGGWDGMPGYASGALFTDFITGGIGIQIGLGKGFVNRFLSIEVRGGVRSNHKYSFIAAPDFTSMVPFAHCLEAWDLGISAGFGLETPVGDVILGAGFNKNLQLALYMEIT
ncbi:MAG: patatin-like phospholipase family protein [Spirochaetales bacterium]|nr:patatin-like phospholipase family protein [Spirochaetales bacterium]